MKLKDNEKLWTPHRSGQLLVTHSPDACKGTFCCVHNPSNHHMRDWPQHYRVDRGITERICPCGVGHPDPDLPYHKDSYMWVHGCCGHCDPNFVAPSKEATTEKGL